MKKIMFALAGIGLATVAIEAYRVHKLGHVIVEDVRVEN